MNRKLPTKFESDRSGQPIALQPIVEIVLAGLAVAPEASYLRMGIRVSLDPLKSDTAQPLGSRRAERGGRSAAAEAGSETLGRDEQADGVASIYAGLVSAPVIL